MGLFDNKKYHSFDSRKGFRSLWVGTLGCVSLPVCLLAFVFSYTYLVSDVDKAAVEEAEGTAKVLLVIRTSAESIVKGAGDFFKDFDLSDPDSIKEFFSGEQEWPQEIPAEVIPFTGGVIKSVRSSANSEGELSWEITYESIQSTQALDNYFQELRDSGWKVDTSISSLAIADYPDRGYVISIKDLGPTVIFTITASTQN